MNQNIDIEDIQEAQHSQDIGFCVECGQKNEGIKPSDRWKKCECCGNMKVLGLNHLQVGSA